MTWKKRIISIALCLCALLCAASVRAEAAGAATTHTDHPICGANHKDVGDHTSDNCSTPTWTAWNGKSEITYTNNVAYIYLSDDVTLEDAKPLTVSTNQTLYLCLNGHSIKMKYNGGYRVINVESGNLILCDCKGGGTITQDTGNKYKDRGVYVQKKYGETTPGTFTMYGGSITGNAGGVKIDSDCTFTMCSGNITANAVDSDRGGGVNVYNNGTFTMYNGEISHNSAYFGGGVYNGGKFTMSGGSITNNTAKGDGGGVNNDSKFIMSGGKITSNTATGDGGGVYGGLTMSGGSITNNTAKGDGGGVEAVGDAVQITGGEITGNTATSNGGGVCFYNSDLTISSAAKVANNKAAKGGGVFFQGYTVSNTLTISDSAQITDNTAAENGGGIYISQNKNVTFLLSGSINISGNKKSVGENASTPNNVYLPSGYVITLTGKLTNTQKIGVTTENTPSESCISITATCYNNELVSAAKDKFTYENDSSYSIVTRSNGKVLAVCDHVYDTTKWSSDETNHYHKCKNCDTTKDTTAHSYSSDWKTDNSKHWHECECGQKSEEAEHSYSTAWKIGDGKHWHECVCGQKSGEAEHSYSTAWDRDNTSHFHKCSACGDKTDIAICVYKARVTSGHQKSDATCTAKAVYWKSCVCDRESTETFESGETNPNNHTGQLGDWQTNTDEHWKVYSCCQAQSDKAAHDWDDGEVTTPATCTADGVKTLTCTACSATKTEPVPATGHTEVVDAAVEATCTKPGKTEGKHCSVCSTVLVEQTTVLAKGHTEVIDAAVEATCTKTGLTEGKHCSVCNAVLVAQKAVPAKGHTEVIDAAVEATCTATGKTEGKHCSVCNAVLVAQKVVPAKGHTEVVDAAVEATCTKTGLTEGKHCSVCNAVLVEQQVVPAKGHTEVIDAAVEATCTATGKTAGKHCSVCNAVLVAQQTVPVKAHDWGTQWISNDSDNDHHWHKCKNCNAIDASTKAPHSWDNVKVTTPATCTTPGEKTFTCTACSATKTEPVPATGHTPGAAVRENIVAATCTTAGSYDEVVYCTACGNEVSRTQKTIDKLAHDYDTTTWVKADENQHGHKCKNCDAITDLTAHVPGAAATETTPQLCTVCGYVIAPATHPVHTWVFVAETPATCNAAGEREHYKCTCGRTSFKNDDAYDINEDASVLTIEKNSANHTGAPDSKWHSDSANHWQEYTCCHARANEAAHSGGAATCTAQAVCEVCGKAYGPLAAHAWQPATCTAPKTCSVCHTTEGTALGHDWGAWKVTTPATKDAPGVETRTCAHNSAHTETRSIPKLSTAVYTVSEDTKIAQIEAKVDGLDKILESDENKALVNDGKSVGVSLTVKNTASSGVSEKIKEKLAGSNLVGLRLELTVEKTVTANGVVESKQTIPDAGVLLKTTITLPAELQGKSGYVVYRLHDGNVHVLTETANENGEFISVSANKTQITICARLYSEYVIAYQTGGSSGGGYHPVNPTPVKATSANTGDAGVLLYGVTAALSLTGTAWLGAKSRRH